MKKWRGALALAAMLALGGAAYADIGVFQGDQDLGRPGDDPAFAGSASFNSGTSTYTVTGSGSDWWDAGEYGHLLYKQTTGDFRIESNIQVVGDPANDWAKFGVALRNNLDTGAGNEKRVNYFTAITDPFRADGARIAFQGRPTDASNMFDIESLGAQPNDGTVRLALQRTTLHGVPYITSYYDRGAGWQLLSGTFAPNLAASPYVGLAVTAHDNTRTETALFTNTQFTAPVAVTDPTDLANMPAARTVASPTLVSGLWSIREVINNGNLGNLDQTAASLNSVGSSLVKNYTAPKINILDSGGDGHFTGNAQFGVVGQAGAPTLGNVDNLALIAKAHVIIPADGLYTFGVNSDDGFELSIDGKSVANFNAGRGAGDTLGVVNLSAGVHDISLLYWEGGGGSEVELFAAQGLYGGFDSSMKLVGDSANGGLALAAVPEPASLGLLAFGALGLLARRRRA